MVEVDITSTDLDKNRLYAALGVPELWRYNGRQWRIFRWQDGDYQECDRSPTFPWVAKDCLYQCLAQARQDEIAAERTWRTIVQAHAGSSERSLQ